MPKQYISSYYIDKDLNWVAFVVSQAYYIRKCINLRLLWRTLSFLGICGIENVRLNLHTFFFIPAGSICTIANFENRSIYLAIFSELCQQETVLHGCLLGFALESF